MFFCQFLPILVFSCFFHPFPLFSFFLCIFICSINHPPNPFLIFYYTSMLDHLYSPLTSSFSSPLPRSLFLLILSPSRSFSPSHSFPFLPQWHSRYGIHIESGGEILNYYPASYVICAALFLISVPRGSWTFPFSPLPSSFILSFLHLFLSFLPFYLSSSFPSILSFSFSSFILLYSLPYCLPLRVPFHP